MPLPRLLRYASNTSERQRKLHFYLESIAIENTNKLIRQYIPKGTNINDITEAYICKKQKKINRRPR